MFSFRFFFRMDFLLFAGRGGGGVDWAFYGVLLVFGGRVIFPPSSYIPVSFHSSLPSPPPPGPLSAAENAPPIL